MMTPDARVISSPSWPLAHSSPLFHPELRWMNIAVIAEPSPRCRTLFLNVRARQCRFIVSEDMRDAYVAALRHPRWRVWHRNSSARHAMSGTADEPLDHALARVKRFGELTPIEQKGWNLLIVRSERQQLSGHDRCRP
jgi:hypothetical protein